MVIPNAVLAIRASSRPMLPYPMMPSVEPRQPFEENAPTAARAAGGRLEADGTFGRGRHAGGLITLGAIDEVQERRVGQVAAEILREELDAPVVVARQETRHVR